MDEATIKADMRLFVLESLVALLWASTHRADLGSDPVYLVADLKKRLTDRARNQTFAGVDPALSDLLSAELEAAIDRAMAMQEGWLGLKPPQG